MKGIDVSRWQGVIDWGAVKAAGIEFAILKAGGSDSGFYKDSTFERNYEGAKAAGVYVGAYYFVGSKCISYEDGVADARRFLEMLKGKQFEFPVYIDLESTSIADKEGATQACIGFCRTMENAGYYAGIYASDISGFVDRLNLSKLTAHDKWVARYGSKPTHAVPYGMWQSSSTGKVKGINGNVDTDESFKDYPALIKSAGLNGFKKQEQPKPDLPDWKEKHDKLADKLNRIEKIIEE